MRIIGGIHSSRKLAAPKDDTITRPITDRVKQSLFDRLWAEGLFEGGNIVDIFAGVGSLGLEALSRGSEHCTFIERHKAIRQLLEQNIEMLSLGKQSTVLKVDALTTGWIGTLARTPISLVFCDPPYDLSRDEKGMARVALLIQALARVVGPSGVVVLRTDDHTEAPEIEGWIGPRVYSYGSMLTHLYDRPDAD